MMMDGPKGEHLALYGGSFNPPHVGHVLAMAYCLSTLDIDRVWMVPTHRHAFGKFLLDHDVRMKMCALAAEPFGDRVFVSDIEWRIQTEGRTIRLVDHLLKEDPTRKITLIIGADILPDLPRWSESERLFRITCPIVLGRSGCDNNSDPRVFSPPLPAVSSTFLREQFAKKNLEACRSLIPRRVFDLVVAENLYI